MLLDLRTNQWSQFNLGRGAISLFTSQDRRLYRIPVAGGKAEKIVDLRGSRGTGYYGAWSDLDPDDIPLLLRDPGTYDIYALALERK